MQCIECSWVHHTSLTMKILSSDDSLFSVRAPMPLSTLWTHYLDWSGRENCDTPNGSPWSGSCAFPRQHPLHQPFWLKSTITWNLQYAKWFSKAADEDQQPWHQPCWLIVHQRSFHTCHSRTLEVSPLGWCLCHPCWLIVKLFYISVPFLCLLYAF